MDIEGLSLKDLKSLSNDEQDALLRFGRPLAFHIGTAHVLAEFNRYGRELAVNLVHVDGGGEGVLLVLWKAVEHYAADRGYTAIHWNVHALTCARPNTRLQRFLRSRGFTEVDHPKYGPILALTTLLSEPAGNP